MQIKYFHYFINFKLTRTKKKMHKTVNKKKIPAFKYYK